MPHLNGAEAASFFFHLVCLNKVGEQDPQIADLMFPRASCRQRSLGISRYKSYIFLFLLKYHSLQ